MDLSIFSKRNDMDTSQWRIFANYGYSHVMKNNILISRIQARMTELNTNALQLSVAARLGKTAVRDIIAGKSRRPTMDTIGKIANALGCTVAYLVGDVDDPQMMRTYSGPLDMQMVRVSHLVEAGVFKRVTSPLSPLEVPVIQHPGYMEHHLEAYLMADESMGAAGIKKGDVLTVASPFADGKINLSNGALVICAQNIVPPMITEISARKVVVDHDDIELHTCPTDVPADIIKLDSQPAQFPKNLYMSKEDNGVSIEGVVIRVTREMP
jgi:hypothetical protein